LSVSDPFSSLLLRHIGLKKNSSLRACSAGLKNIVLADCCERKILFWHNVNSDSVSWLVSQPAGLKPAEHAQIFAGVYVRLVTWLSKKIQ